MPIIETPKGRYINFILPKQDSAAWEAIERHGGNVSWAQDKHCWMCCMTEAAFAKWQLEKEFGRGAG